MDYRSPLFASPNKERHAAGRSLTQEEQQEIEFAWKLLDGEGNGHVALKGLKVALRALGFPVKKADVRDLIDSLGQDPEQSISYDLFHKALSIKMTERTHEQEMHRAFQLFDQHGNGKIDLPTLRKISNQLQLPVEEDELYDMIAEFDKDGDGMISLQEFASIMSTYDE